MAVCSVKCVMYTHTEASVNDALDDVVDLTLVPACDDTEYWQGTVNDTGGSTAYLALSQTNALVAERLDGVRGQSG